MGTDGRVLSVTASRAANGRDWFVFRAGEWTLAAWRADDDGRVHVAPCVGVDDRPGDVLGAARLDEELVGALPIAIPVDPILERVAACLWSADPVRREQPPSPLGPGMAAALSAELAAGLADALASPALIEQLRAIGRELDGDPHPA